MRIMIKSYLVEVSTNLESMFTYLRDFGFKYYVHPFDKWYYEIEVMCNEEDIADLESIMQWYV